MISPGALRFGRPISCGFSGRVPPRRLEYPPPGTWCGKQAAAQDAAEDRQHGGDRRGDELPDWVANKERRLAKIREAKAALEAEAPAAAGQGAGADSEVAAKRGRKGQPPSDVPEDNAQRNFTDPESRIMKTKDGFIQGYNAQAAVDAEHQIIVSCDHQPGHGQCAAAAINRPDQGQH